MWARLFGVSVGLIATAIGVLGCATSFTGDAKFPGGARGCWEACKRDGMEMASFVYVGEFSTACACKPAGSGAHAEDDAAGVPAAVAGVETQRREAEQQQHNQMMMHH
jgi:hypothetical protein